MRKKQIYNSLVLFEAPIYLDETWVYGLMFNKQKQLEILNGRMTIEENIQQYVQYIVGSAEWLKSGNSISDDKRFYIKGDHYYYVNDYYATKFCREAYNNNPLKYNIILDCNPSYTKDDLDDSFIISKEAYNRFKTEYEKD